MTSHDEEPWHESHAPQNFHRRDESGRWSPLVEREYDWFDRHPVLVAWVLAIMVVAGILLVRNV